MSMGFRIELSRHAQVRAAIKRGSKKRQTDGWIASYKYIRVAYKLIRAGAFKVKTVFIG